MANFLTCDAVMLRLNTLGDAGFFQSPTPEAMFASGNSFAPAFFDGFNACEDRLKSLEFAVPADGLEHSIARDLNGISVKEVKHLPGGDASGACSTR